MSIELRSSGASLDSRDMEAVTGGRWQTPPASDWRYEGLCYYRNRQGPGRIVLAETPDFYGVDLRALEGEMGRAGIIVAADAPGVFRDFPILRVESVRRAILGLARHVRSAARDTPTVAVTGSVGKTSTCAMLRQVLGPEGRVFSNGQFNEEPGILCELCNAAGCDFLVVEAALQGFGEATAILKPQVAVLTQVSPVHVESSFDLLTLTEQKSRLFQDLAPGGTAILNRDLPFFERALAIARTAAGNVLSFGEHAEADFRLLDYDLGLRRVRARIRGEELEYVLGLRGRHMAINSLGVLAAAQALGVPLARLLPRLRDTRAVPGRGVVEQLVIRGRRILLIDDAFNASPASMLASIATLAAMPTAGRRIVALGDMLELGDMAASYHLQLAKPLAEAKVDKAYLTGEMMRALWKELPAGMRGAWNARPAGLLRPLVDDLRDGDVVLVKGSHGTHIRELAHDLRYLTLMKPLRGAGPVVFPFLKAGARSIEPHLPVKARQWAAWQLDKLVRRRVRLASG